MKKNKFFIAGLLIVSLPFLVCLIFKFSFAAIDSLYSTMIPYAKNSSNAFPFSHFWSDTANFYWPRYSLLSNLEFPISFTTGGGLPLYADSISGFYTPIAWLTFGLFGASINTLTFFWLLQYLALYSGLYFWFSKTTSSPTKSVSGALLFTYCTAFFHGSYMSFQTLGALCFLPWAFWAAENFKNSSKQYWVPSLFLILCITGGNLQMSVYPLIAYGLWSLINRKLFSTFYTLACSILFTLPFWLTSIEYHILQNYVGLARRHSEVPPSFFTRVKALLAIPSLIVPDLFGSPHSIDFLKAFQTSQTYFIGSIGAVAGILSLTTINKKNLKDKNFKFGVALLVFTVFVMLTPLLNTFYYRILCLTCFGLVVMFVFGYEKINPRILRIFSWTTGSLLILSTIASFAVKRVKHQVVEDFLISRLNTSSSYAWWPELQTERASRFFSDYLSTPAFLFSLLLILLIPILYKRNRNFLLVVAVLGSFCTWWNQVSFNPIKPAVLGIHEDIKTYLQGSPNYPLSRMDVIDCGQGPFIFNFGVHEFNSIPKIGYYGSTAVASLPHVIFKCEHDNQEIILDPNSLKANSVNLLITRSDWNLKNKDFEKLKSYDNAILWKKKSSPFLPAIDAEGVATNIKQISSNSFNLEVNTVQSTNTWTLNIPYYPGWKYKLDGSPIFLTEKNLSRPSFTTPLSKGTHRVSGHFTPFMFYVGLLGTFFAMVLMLWKSTSKHA